MGRKTVAKQKQKIDAVYKIVGDKSLKAKGRAKPVNIKTFKTRDRVEKSNKQLEQVRDLMSTIKKSTRSAGQTSGMALPEEMTIEDEGQNICPQKSFNDSVNDISDLHKSLKIS